jgi:hypothetical protein
VVPGENPAELEALALDYFQQFDPSGPVEEFLVDTLVLSDWNRRRYTRIEAQILQADAPTGKAAQQIFHRLAATERSYFRALRELRRIQRERQANGEAVAPDAVPPAGKQLLDSAPASPEAPRIGFVLPVRAQPAPPPAA